MRCVLACALGPRLKIVTTWHLLERETRPMTVCAVFLHADSLYVYIVRFFRFLMSSSRSRVGPERPPRSGRKKKGKEEQKDLGFAGEKA